VDDLFLIGSERLIVECKRALTSEFEMKDRGMMHYFLGLEVRQRTDEIFLSQGKYTVEILKMFGMTDCKSMPTPMVMDLKKMNEASTDSCEIDPHLYRQLIGSLMYRVNTRPDICSECTKSVHESVETDSLDNSEPCIEISTRHSWIWPEICLQCRHEIAWICRCRLGRERSVPEEHIQLLFYLRVCHGFLVQQEIELCGFEYCRSRVYSIECGSPRSNVASQAPDKFI
jgi:hypothetical protein